MPDHVHILVEGQESASDLRRFVKALKQRTGFLYQREVHEQLWQKKFYDHILRRNDAPDTVAWYIWMNPVRKGICAQPKGVSLLRVVHRAVGKGQATRRVLDSTLEKETRARLKAAAT